MGQDGERRNTYSAAVIEDNSLKTTPVLAQRWAVWSIRTIRTKNVVVCLPGARIEHIHRVRESRTDNGKMKWRVHTSTRRDEHRRQGRNDSDSGEVQEPTDEDEASKGWTDNLIRNSSSV